MQVSKLSADAAQAAVWRDVRRDLREAPISEQATRLAVLANSARRQIVDMISGAGQGHIGGDLSVIDMLTTIYFGVLRHDPANPGRADRDRIDVECANDPPQRQRRIFGKGMGAQ